MYTCLFVIIGLTSLGFLTSYFALISLAMSFWPDPDLPVSIGLMAAHADREGTQTLAVC